MKQVRASDINMIMLQTKALKYFGFLSMEFEKVIVYDNPKTSYVEIKGNNLVYHLQNDATIANAVALTVHIILHILSNHFDRQGSRNEMIWTLATDHCANYYIRRMCEYTKKTICRLPDDHIYFPQLAQKDPDMIAEEAYTILMDNVQEIPCGFSSSLGEIQDNGNTVEVSATGNGKSMQGGKDTTKGNGGKDKQDSDGKSNGNGNNPDNNDGNDDNGNDGEGQSDADFQKKLDSVRDSGKLLFLTDSTDLKGDIDAKLVRYLESLFDVNIVWEEILRQALKYYAKSPETRTWTRKNLYIPHYRVPGYGDDCNEVNTLIIAVDLSGSISDKDFGKFVSIICEASKFYKKLIVLPHEVSVSEVITLQNTNPKASFDKVRQMTGGGGTSHEDVFDHIEDIYMAGSDLISSVVFLTDFYSDVEQIYSRYKFLRDMETVWVVPQYKEYGTKEVILPGCKTTTIPVKL